MEAAGQHGSQCNRVLRRRKQQCRVLAVDPVHRFPALQPDAFTSLIRSSICLANTDPEPAHVVTPGVGILMFCQYLAFRSTLVAFKTTRYLGGPNFFLVLVPPLQATVSHGREEPVKGLRCAASERAKDARP